MKRIYFTVTNDLSYDQRMHRICTTLAENGYDITLVGRQLPSSLPLENKKFKQERIRCWFNKGKWFYAEYNMRLYIFLRTRKMDAVCAIDLDTILPCLRISKKKKVKRVYDAHELFTELKEVITRPAIRKAWSRIEQKAVPQFRHGYTVSEGIAEEFRKRYGVEYATIRNVPFLVADQPATPALNEKIILYQGAVNKGRGLEFLIPAMKEVNAKLIICGDGNFMQETKQLIRQHGMEDKIEMTGMLTPEQLRQTAGRAYMAVAVPEKEGLNQWLALPNKFFDYIQAGLPQVTMGYPEYKKINAKFEVAVLLDEPDPYKIAAAINNLLEDGVLYQRLKQNCIVAREELNWQREEKKLLAFYQSIFST